MNIKKIFKESSKRVFGAILLFIGVALALDAHFSCRELNIEVFKTLMYVGGGMIGAGVLEKRLNSANIGDNSELE